MTRTREWTKFGLLVVVTILFAVGFAAAVDLPRSTTAQARTVVTLPATPAPVIPQAKPASDLGQAFVAVAEAVRPAVVYIQAEVRQERGSGLPFGLSDPSDPNDLRRGQGSGFIISRDGYIITNNHVVENATRLTVSLVDRRSFEAELIGRDPLTDIAVIKIDAERLTPVSLGDAESVHIGEWALAIGNPLGFSFSVTAGIISGRGRRLEGLRPSQAEYSIHDFIQTDAAINPGNSGGPLVNIRGQVIGVNSAIASRTGLYTGYGFAVPIDLAKAVSEQLIANGHVTRAVLGIQIVDADALDAEYVGLDSIFGVKVQGFGVDSPSQRAGLREGDIIIAVDGVAAMYTAQLQTKIGFRQPGETVQVTVARKDGERQTYQVQLKEAREAQSELMASAEEPRRRNSRSHIARLGIAVEEVTQTELTNDGLDRAIAAELSGLRITAVDPDGPARDGRLFQNEVLTHIDGERVYTRDDLDAALNGVRPNTIVSLRTALIQRGELRHRTVRIRALSQ